MRRFTIVGMTLSVVVTTVVTAGAPWTTTSTTSTCSSSCLPSTTTRRLQVLPAVLPCFASSKVEKKHKSAKTKTSSGNGFSPTSPSTYQSSSKNKKNTNALVQHQSTTRIVPSLLPKAKKLLQRHGNNIDAASQDYFTTRMQSIHDDDNQHQQHSPSSSLSSSSSNLHTARVAAAWDTVALFLPHDYARTKGQVEPHVQRRLGYIAQACMQSSSSSLAAAALVLEPSSSSSSSSNDNESQQSSRITRILDVGCGDGALLHYLPFHGLDYRSNSNFNQSQEIENKRKDPVTTYYYDYTGIDVSAEMIELGLRQHPHANLQVGSFPECLVPAPAPNANNHQLFDTILFNGSLQFFRDTRQVLQAAMNHLTVGGRIVLSHVNGAKFVREECRSNPTIAVRTLPNLISLQDMAKQMSADLVTKEQLVLGGGSPTHDDYHNQQEDSSSSSTVWSNELDGDDDQFYLVALVKKDGRE